MTQRPDHQPAVIVGADGWMIRNPAFADPAEPADIPFERLDDAITGRPVLERFDAIVARFGAKLAVDDGAVALTYDELAARVDLFAAQLERAAPPGRPIAAIVHNVVAYPAILLAALAIGRILVPIDASHPIERQAAILNEVRPGLVVTTLQQPADISFVPAGIPRLALDVTSPQTAARPARTPDLDAPAALTFTSGSTGKPKGVAVSERSYLLLTAEHVNAAHIHAGDRICCLATLSAMGGRECLSALLTGASIRLVDLKAAGMTAALRALSDCTILSFVPSVMRMILGIPGVEASVANLRILALGGETLLATDLAMFREKLSPHCRINSIMGTTEATSVFHWFARAEAYDGDISPSGYLVPDQNILLVDNDGLPVPPGATGELIVRGRRLAVGSWRDGALTLDPFERDPADPARRIYATGDLMRLRADGLAVFAGRRDRMIKINGQQVDLGQVEAALRSYAGIADAAVLPVARASETRLAAFVVAEDDPVDAIALRRHVQRETAPHMAPTHVYALGHLPRLASNKPDLVQLEALARERWR